MNCKDKHFKKMGLLPLGLFIIKQRKGLRESYTLPSHPDQAGFHEGFANIVCAISNKFGPLMIFLKR